MDWKTRLVLGLLLGAPVVCGVCSVVFGVFGNIPACVGFGIATLGTGMYAAAVCA